MRLTISGPSSPRRVLLPLLAVLACAGAAGAQPVVSTPLRFVMSRRDAGGTLKRLGDSVRVTGIVTTTPHRARGPVWFVVIQDGAAGIRLVTDSFPLIETLRRGDRVRADGVLTRYRGAEELVLTDLEVTGHGPTPPIHDVLVSDLRDKRWMAQLIRVEGELRVYTLNDSQRFEFRDRTGVIPVRIPTWILANAETASHVLRGGRLSMVAVLGQSAPKGTHQGGHRLAPRDAGDLKFVVRPPYEQIAGVVLIGLLAGLGGYLWRQRKLAEARAKATESMTDELRRSESALRASESRYRTLMEQSTDGIFLFDEETTIQVVNATACRMLRSTRERLVGRKLGGVVVAGEMARQPMLFDRLNAGEVLRREREMMRDDGTTFAAEIASKRLPDGQYLGIARDISERRETEERLRRSEEQLRQAQRMEAVGQLAGGIAHDFNNILTAMQLHAESLLSQIPPDDPRHEEVLEIQRSGTRAGSLTRQLLAFSRRQILRPQLLLLNDVVHGVHRMLLRLLGEDLQFALRLDPDLHFVVADPGQLEQVLVNLAVNARDAMPRGGTLTIAARNVVLDETFTRENAGSNTGEFVAISVADTGTGMTPEVQARVFEPFFTTKEIGKGTGLGMSTVYGIVKQSGGFVRVESAIGCGTIVTVYIPRATIVPAAVERQVTPQSVPALATSGATVLLVEDEDGVRGLARRILERQGFVVLEARNGREALTIAAARPDCIDLVLSDVVMPEMGGAELREALREVCPSAPVILTSGYTDEDVVRRGVNTNEVPFLPKPFTSTSLIAAVHAALV